MSLELIPQWWRRIFAWFANRQLRKISAKFHCPSCQATFPCRVHAELLWEEVLPCPECGNRARFISYFKRPADTEEIHFADTLKVVEQPPDSRIVAESTGSGRRWEIPAKGGWNVWTVFAVAFLLFSTLVFGGVFLEAKNWTQTLAPLVFPVIGMTILYGGLRASFARHTLEVDPVELVYTRRFLGLTKRKSVRREAVQRVELACIYVRRHDTPVYGLEVKTTSGRIRFGSALQPQEKAWLCQQVREALGMGIGTEAPAPANAVCEWRGGRLEMERGSDHASVRSHTRSAGTAVFIGGLFFIGLGLSIPLNGGIGWAHWNGDSVAFYILFNALHVLWFLGMVGGALAGIWLMTFGWISRRTTRVLHANAQSLSLVATSGRRTIERTWKVEDVGELSVVLGMRMNGTPIYHAVVMLPDRVVNFGLGAPRKDLQRAVQLLGDAMGRTQPSRT